MTRAGDGVEVDYARQVERFRELGRLAGEAHAAVHDAFRRGVRAADPGRYDALLQEFRAATARALPGDEVALGRNIDAGNSRALHIAIAFLDADPWFFRSGYLKARLIRHVKRAALDAGQTRILQNLVMRVVEMRDRRELAHYRRLARFIQSPGFVATLDDRAQCHPDAGVRRRARFILDGFDQAAS